MTKLFKLVKDLLSMDQILQARDEAYLAEAADTFELERRMREIERGGNRRFA
ncbi:DUF3563 family protein [Variovorax sp. J22R133]|uniref:DUF3563 family protein n=1 Tax=Variovorax brevis TaxID=3053503 RepID=UPI0025758F1F|nr:DUF3563 family protein [Variovorax sp. J22R133]MDM0114054.1 DUF3563 family protein [Variovorax sp. J22R133]